MFEKKCRCGAPATVMLNDQFLCGEHAFQKVMAMKGQVPLPKPVK